MYRKFFLISILVIAFIQGKSESISGLEKGDKVPVFNAVDQDGKPFSSEDLKGKHLVVYFYPAAMTGGCTKQACSYRDDLKTIKSLNACVVGVSGDMPEALSLFKQAHDLNFTLLSDPDAKLANMFGVPSKLGTKTIEREVNGVLNQLIRKTTSARWTFIISDEGELVYKSSQVDAAQDSKVVIDQLKELNK